MSDELDTDAIAAALFGSVSLLVRRIRQVPTEGGLTVPEREALSQLERGGPATSSELARQGQITAQAMGTTVGALQARGLVERNPDPEDGRRLILTVTDAGRQQLRDKRNARTELLSRVMAGAFTPAELAQFAAAAPLLERLAQNI
ncbi:DNA-binding transcriptional regulator, MarR family [Streptomyces sp. DvalAA-14]|uniref:MarR family winged helix-turn-helix transcriptional regulator n=1 Tax=unclassified Streptomyces TaxID=2593676 RepID=UPI00081B60DD|nr:MULTISPECIES: MarR family transcriptional regulator [unclassified Streptomyces]MYS21399.1 MarR family transcriptional regulator [Streptomyces sp. SID4948]SCD91579.1 DNA-binding transcriptional regulator, MarR family [Streptomyces sp. DvalAA-14]